MARTRIICPTYNHVETLLAAIPSVQAQRDGDWDLVVIGDGAPDRTREIVESFAQDDLRISYVAHQKGERFGESYRDPVIRNCDAEFICHLGDDDIWHESHLDVMARLLAGADWAMTGDLRLSPSGEVTWRFGNVSFPPLRVAACADDRKLVFATLNGVGVRRRAYLSLPRGWEPSPTPRGSDVFMWLKYIRKSDLRLASTAEPTHVKFQSAGARADVSPAERLAELQPVAESINRPSYLDKLRQRATIGGPLAKAFGLVDLAGAQDLRAAFGAVGIVPGDETDGFTHGAGSAMHVPLTHRQLDQARLAWALASGPDRDPERFRAVVRADRRDDGLTLHYLEMIAQANPEVALVSARALATVCQAPALSAHARVRVLLQGDDLAAAEHALERAREQWRKARWVGGLERRLSGLRASGNAT